MLGAVFLLPAGASANDVREIPLAEGRSVAPLTPGVSSLSAAYGVAAWVESRERRGGIEFRIGAESGGRVVHRGWTKQPRKAKVLRRLDRRSGKAVVRVLDYCAATSPGTCKGQRLLHPRTLLATTTEFGRASGDPVVIGDDVDAVDGAIRASAEATVDAGEPDPMSLFDRPSTCSFTVKGLITAVPGLGDCSQPTVSTRYGLLLLSAWVPSRTAFDGATTTSRVTAFDLRDATAGWHEVGERSSGKGGSNGVLQSCLLDGAIAMLRGQTDDYGVTENRPPWTVEVVPVRRGAQRWSAEAPRLTPGRSVDAVTLACSGRSVYAQSSSTRDGVDRSRVVRLVRPR
jgi:hypothetical protein